MFNGENFKKLRKQKKITQNEVAKLIGVDRTTIVSWESGRRTPTAKNIEKLAAILKSSTDDLSTVNNTEKSLELANDINLFKSSSYIKNVEQFVSNGLNNILKQLHSTSSILIGIIESIDILLYIKNTENKYMIANNSFLLSAGLSNNYKVTGTTDYNFFPKNEAAKNEKEDLDVIQNRKTLSYEGYLPNSRKKRWCCASKHPIVNKKGETVGIIGYFTDITEKKRSYLKLEALAKAVSGMDAFIYLGKYKPNGKFNFYYHNNKFEKVFGYSIENYTDNPSSFIDHVIPKYKNDVKTLYDSKEYPKIYRYTFKRPDNGNINFMKEKRYYTDGYYFGVSQNVTQKEDSKLIKAQLKNIDFILDTINISLILIDYETSEVLFSKNTEKVTGYTEYEVNTWGRDYWVQNIIHPDNREAELKYTRTHNFPETRHVKILKKDGSTITHLCKHVIKEHHGKKYRVVINIPL